MIDKDFNNCFITTLISQLSPFMTKLREKEVKVIIIYPIQNS